MILERTPVYRRNGDRVRCNAGVPLRELAYTLALLTATGTLGAAHAAEAANSTRADKPAQNARADETAPAKEASTEHTDDSQSLREMFTQGDFDGELRLLYFTNRNAFFAEDVDRNTATVGGHLGFTSASLHGFSLRVSAYAQRGIDHAGDPAERNRDLGPDLSTLGEAYVQWRGRDFRVRAGNQALDAPFTATYDYRIIPQLYQGVSARWGDDTRFLTAMRMFRYKSRISESFDRTTNYNREFEPFAPNTDAHTDGFWAVGAGDTVTAGPAEFSGQAWYFEYKDYARMFYTEGRIAEAEGDWRPFLGLQYIRETEDGRALVGEVDHHTYGAQLGVEHGSLTATLNYDAIPSEPDTYLNGALVTPYAHNEASGPLFAQPFLTSTQDLGSGDAYAAEIKGAPLADTVLGARYSYMDLTPAAGTGSIDQSEYLIYGIYQFDGALSGLSIADFMAYQSQPGQPHDFWENRLKLSYSF